MANGSRFHIEINSVKVDDMSVRFNIFGDTLAQVTADLEQVIVYVTGNPQSPAAVLTALTKPAVAVATALKPTHQKSQTTAAKPSALVGACCACGRDSLEWVTGTRKDNGKSFAAFKCQECGKWQPEAKL
jgi:predicted metalloprotease with PDZ domain